MKWNIFSKKDERILVVDEKILSPKMVILLILSQKEKTNKYMGITRLQKLAFLLTNTKEFSQVMDSIEFERGYYGPVSTKMMEDLEVLKMHGFVEFSKTDGIQPSSERYDEDALEELEGEYNHYHDTIEYSLTEKGMKVASVIYNTMSKTHKHSFNMIMQTYLNLPFPDLLRRVYKQCNVNFLISKKLQKELGYIQ